MIKRNSTSFKNAWTFIVSLFAIVLLMSWQPANAQCASDDPSAAGIIPVQENFPGGDPVCAGGIRLDSPGSGTYDLGIYGKVTIVVTETDCGHVFSWSVTPGIVVGKIYVKGGTDQNIYEYPDPVPTSDSHLHAPLVSSGKYAGLSHVDFCFTYVPPKLKVSKTAETSYKLKYGWSIEKLWNKTYDIFRGDKVEHKFKVSVVRDNGTPVEMKVTGVITITNTAIYPATITGVEDVISGVGNVTADCAVTFPYVLDPGETLECTYTSALPDKEQRLNTVTVTTSGDVGGNTATADVKFGDPDGYLLDQVTVNDTNGQSWTASGSTSWEYTEDYTCFSSGSEYKSTCEYVNTATIAETGQKASAKVIINCYELLVTKTAATSMDRTFIWKISKTHDAGASCLVLTEGQMYSVNYSVVVDIASFVDSNWKVAGTITVSNPAPMAATISNLADVISGDIAATVDCPTLTVPAGGSVTCTYSADLPDGTNRTNTATATLPNVYYKANGTTEPNGSVNFSGTAAVDFSTATINEIDECVDVTDSYAGTLGTACKASAPTTFNYSRDVGIQGGNYVCGDENLFENTATFTTNDTGATGSDDADVCVIIPCPGCTLTPGYWKTHSEFGPAPYDDTWAKLPGGASTSFFLSGKTYYEALWTPPAGNAYYILAHAYIAAHLNLLNGVHFASAQLSYDKATTLFSTITPAQVAASKGKDGTALRNQFIDLAKVLDNYNNGLIGPGHCSDNTDNTKYGALEIPALMNTNGVTELNVYPNPFSTRVTFEFVAGRDADARIEIFNMLGQKVSTVMDQFVREGVLQRVEFAPLNIERGMLFYRLTLDEEVFNGKVLYSR